MNTLAYYTRSSIKWSEEECEQLRKEYMTDNLDILEIGNIHRRTPGCIAHKLKAMEIITYAPYAKGYVEYKASELYKEICTDSVQRDEERAKRRAEKERVLAEKEVVKTKQSTSSNEFERMKVDIAEMKRDIKMILHYMTSLYEFETSNT